MSDDTVTTLPIDDEAAAVAAAMQEAFARRTAMRLARLRREAANDNRRQS